MNDKVEIEKLLLLHKAERNLIEKRSRCYVKDGGMHCKWASDGEVCSGGV